MSSSNSPPPQQGAPKQGMPAALKVLMAVGLVAFLVIAVAFVVGIFFGVRRATHGGPTRGAALPPVERHVPKHSTAVLAGCSADDVSLIEGDIGRAIDVGAPLYNTGDFAGCYHMYDGAASDLGRKLSSTCAGPKSALAAGQSGASKLGSPSDQAWAMRDTFDGLLDVTHRAR